MVAWCVFHTRGSEQETTWHEGVLYIHVLPRSLALKKMTVSEEPSDSCPTRPHLYVASFSLVVVQIWDGSWRWGTRVSLHGPLFAS